MVISTRTPEGSPCRCPVCGKKVVVEFSIPPGDATCPVCGCLLWFSEDMLALTANDPYFIHKGEQLLRPQKLSIPKLATPTPAPVAPARQPSSRVDTVAACAFLISAGLFLAAALATTVWQTPNAGDYLGWLGLVLLFGLSSYLAFTGRITIAAVRKLESRSTATSRI
jgi:hypothetical protein